MILPLLPREKRSWQFRLLSILHYLATSIFIEVTRFSSTATCPKKAKLTLSEWIEISGKAVSFGQFQVDFDKIMDNYDIRVKGKEVRSGRRLFLAEGTRLGIDGCGNMPSDVTHYALETLCRCVYDDGIFASR